jgi:hypothetical protein
LNFQFGDRATTAAAPIGFSGLSLGFGQRRMTERGQASASASAIKLN